MLKKSSLETRLNCFKHIRFKYLITVLLLYLVGLQSIVAQTIINGDFERGFIDPFYSYRGGDKVFVVHKDHARVSGGINSTIKEGIGGKYVLEALDLGDYQSIRTQLDHLVVGGEYKLRFRFAVDDRKSSFDNSHEIFVDIITHTLGTIIEQVKYNTYTTNQWRNAEITFTATQAYHILSIFYWGNMDAHMYFDDVTIEKTDGGSLTKVCAPCDGKSDDYVFSNEGGFMITCGMLDKRINDITIPGTHNSFSNDDEDGKSFDANHENHHISMYQQLLAGIRYLELDVVGGSSVAAIDANRRNTRFAHKQSIGGYADVDNVFEDLTKWYTNNPKSILLLDFSDLRVDNSPGASGTAKQRDKIWNVILDYLDDDTWNNVRPDHGTKPIHETFNNHMIRTSNDQDQDELNYVFPTLRDMYESGQRIFIITPWFRPLADDIRYGTVNWNLSEEYKDRIDRIAPSNQRPVSYTIPGTFRLQRYRLDIDGNYAGSRKRSLDNNAGERIYEVVKATQDNASGWPVNILSVDYFTAERPIDMVDAANRLNFERFGYNYHHNDWIDERLSASNIALNKEATSKLNDTHDAFGASNITDGFIATRWMTDESESCTDCYITIDLGQQKALRSTAIAWVAREPDDWTLKGSNDKSAWSRITTVPKSNQIRIARGYWYYDIDNSQSYRYYRINIIETGSEANSHGDDNRDPHGSSVNAGIWEVKMFERPLSLLDLPGILSTPTSDAFVQQGSSTVNFGDNTTLMVKKDDNYLGGYYNREAFLKFDLSNISETIRSAKIVLFVESIGAGLMTIGISNVEDDTWTESGITWNNKPSIGNGIMFDRININASDYSSGDRFSIDVTFQLQTEKEGDGTLSLKLEGITEGTDKWLKFYSQESQVHVRPILMITTDQTVVSTLTTSIAPVADAFVQQGASTVNFGDNAELMLKKENYLGGYYNRDAFLKFDLSNISGTVTHAKLRLTRESVGGVLHGLVIINAGHVLDDSWMESGISWSNKPSRIGRVSTADQIGSSERIFEIDVTEQTQIEHSGDGTISFQIEFVNYLNNGYDGQWIKFYSKEAVGSGFIRPTLIVTSDLNPTSNEVHQNTARSDDYPDDNPIDKNDEPIIHQTVDILAYPNPINKNNILFVNFGIEMELNNVDITILNYLGKRIYNESVSVLSNGTMQFDIGSLTPGLYILRLTDKKNLDVVKKLIVR